MAAHRYWRINCYYASTLAQDGGISFAEIEMRSAIAGANRIGSGTPSASTFISSTYNAAKGCDGNASTMWVTNTSANATWSYDFGLGVSYDIVEVAITPRNDGFHGETPRRFDIQYSDDNSTWTTSWSKDYTNWITWASGTAQTFNSTTDNLNLRRLYCYYSTSAAANGSMSFAEIEFHATVGGSNIITGGVASASTFLSGTYVPANAIDSNASSFWISTAASTDAWWAYSFPVGAAGTIAEIRLTPRNDSFYRESPTRVTLQSSTDGINWTTISDGTASAWASGTAQTIALTATPATVWNSADKSGEVVLSNGNKTATMTWYPAAGFAIDFTHSKMWVYNPRTQKWNGGILSAENPATNTGGFSIPGLGTPLFPAMSVYQCSALLNCGATPFVNPIPAGFSSWNSLTGATVTWNASDKNANITLSAGNMKAATALTGHQLVRATNSLSSGLAYFELGFDGSTGSGYIGGVATSATSLSNYCGSDSHSLGYQVNENRTDEGGFYTGGSEFKYTGNDAMYQIGNSVRGTNGYNTGKRYFEIYINAEDAGKDFYAGVANSNFGITGLAPGRDAGAAIAQRTSGTVYRANSTVASTGASPVGSYVAVAVDLSNQLIWILCPSTGAWNGSLSSHPETGTLGLSISGLGAWALYPVFGTDLITGGLASATLNPGSSPFIGTIPAGFVGWDGSIPGPAGTTGFFFLG